MKHTEPTEISPVEIVRCIYDAYESGDTRPIAEHFDQDIESYVPDFLPAGGIRHGMQELRDGVAALRMYVTTAFAPDELIDAGKRVVAVGRTVGLVNATGKPYSVRTVHVWHFEGAKATRLEIYVDRAIAPLFQDAA
jgi:ketosteroid isomerase-like protein